MTLLQIVSDPNMYGYIGTGSALGATAGTVVTMLVQKQLNKKKDSADLNVINYDVIDKQFKSLWENINHQNEVIKELQEKSCYREQCQNRMNGEHEFRTRTVKKHTHDKKDNNTD